MSKESDPTKEQIEEARRVVLAWELGRGLDGELIHLRLHKLWVGIAEAIAKADNAQRERCRRIAIEVAKNCTEAAKRAPTLIQAEDLREQSSTAMVVAERIERRR